MREIRVLSLFDGISCGRLALEQLGFNVKKYYASEIDKFAIKVSESNFPDIIRLGDVFDIDFTQFIGKVDMVIGGSPCQKFSVAQTNQEISLDGLGGTLIGKFVEAVNIIKPKYFLLENVASMHDNVRDGISNLLGVKEKFINSANFSAQVRNRYYWCNWEIGEPTEVCTDVIEDILEPNIQDNLLYNIHPKLDETNNSWIKREVVNKNFFKWVDLSTKRLLELFNGTFDKMDSFRIGSLNGIKGQNYKVYTAEGKYSCLDTHGARENIIYCRDGEYYLRRFVVEEAERLQTLPVGYTKSVSKTQRMKSIGNGWNIETIKFIFKNLLKNA